MAGNLWWHKSINDTLAAVDSDMKQGLSLKEVVHRQLHSRNILEAEPSIKPYQILLNQFTDTMVLVLLGATVVSGIIGDMVDAITIMTIVVINAILGFIQEYKAERSLEEIKKMASPFAMVLRGGQRLKIAASELVPGDIVFLDTGDKVPADVRLLQSFGLQVDESALTGESVPVEKNAAHICQPDCLLGERDNMVFMGTAITRGRGQGVVVGTGMQTIMGEIAGMMKDTEKNMTPLQLKLDHLGKVLIIICVLVCTVVAVLGILRGEEVMTMFMAGISLAVAAIPEGLPAIVTVVLALGVQRMSKRNAIIRKLPAVETLGCTTVICSDKTGTLTRNQMTVKKLATRNMLIEIEGDGYQPVGRFISQHNEINPLQDKTVSTLLDIAVNCNNSNLSEVNGRYEIQGDPTEAALLAMAYKAKNTQKKSLLKEIPFDSERKKMSVVVDQDGPFLMVKGALDVIINSCSYIMKDQKITRISADDQRYFLQMQEKWASDAMRILGFACKKLNNEEWEHQAENALESELILVGMCGMIDPPRPGSANSVKKCLGAGIIPIMITGDHPLTAAAIAREIGISKSSSVVNGKEIDGLNDEMLYKRAIQDRVFARVSPQHKNRIVTVLKNRNQVVAMTGDGVNDAPAIKAADIGIAMGISGTQVSKEASSMILTDDDFSTIVQAIYEGRAIYDNIRKFIRYLLGCNIGEVLVMLVSSLMGLPLPMLPIQLLWVNLVTDGLPAMALGVEPPEPGIMNRKPRPKDESIFARGLGWIIFSRGTYIAAITIAAFIIGFLWSRMNGVEALPLARTMAFTTLVFAQLFYVFECRSESYSPFELGFFKNKFLVTAVLCSVVMQLSAIYIPFLQDIFKTVALSGWEWLVIILFSGIKLIWRFMLYTCQELFEYRYNYVKIGR
ncbi:MAG: calcium-translocating P-type ATPase, SERCA-type [Syntrophomonas sp.]|nr:calcium-translocating P-type ATPase, SERCA-type [Syntrophomonas sp.]